MARLILSVVMVAVAAGLAAGLLAGARRLMAPGRAKLPQANRIGDGMKQMSFVVLVALILYASIWGAG